ncbi:hypothetical protein H072_5637 [Dactylellina haptotyla CBS 200.50]|uniref:Rhodopsin domain-containing protein n=1 Tax=Dactylellina haptotyla (strain CBS 200.50) TaxID=1284197 RepID=S8BYQ9_DACHA|nr:hypothetical protein H072_5637 [Dactylellina haptotyla CBS 200.50]
MAIQTDPIRLSTGQTMQDIYELAQLFSLVNLTDNPYTQPGWMPPALLDPKYHPVVRPHGPIILGSSIALGATVILALLKILATQQERRRRNLFLEDWLLVFSIISAIVTFVLTSSCTRFQAGWHVYDVRMESMRNIYTMSMVIDLMSVWIYTLVRVSLLLSFRRLYSPLRTRMQKVCDILVFLKITNFILITAAMVFCVPDRPGIIFDLIGGLRNGADPMGLNIAMCATTFSLDCLILLSPLPLIRQLRYLPEKRKLQIFIIFISGFLFPGAGTRRTVAASAARLWQFTSNKKHIFQDFTWYWVNLEIVNNIEIILSILTSCLPSAKIFYRWAYKKRRFPIGTTHQSRRFPSQAAQLVPSGTVKTAPDAEGASVQTYALPRIYTSEFPPSADKQNDMWRRSRVRQSVLSGMPGLMALLRHSVSIEPEQLPVETETPPSTGEQRIQSGLIMDPPDAYDDEDNFYDCLVPSDSFFPFSTGLTPPPAPRRRNNP